MEPTDITTKILIEIRDEIRSTRTDLREEIRSLGMELSGRIDGTNERIDGTNERLDRLQRHQVETEIRLATEIVAVAGAVHEVRDRLQHGALAAKVADHELRIARIEETRGRR